MSNAAARGAPPRALDWLYYATAIFFFVFLFGYYWTGLGGPVILAVTLVPVTFILHTLESLRQNDFYPRLPRAAQYAIAAVYWRIGSTLSRT